MRKTIWLICFIFIAATGVSLEQVGNVVSVEGGLRVSTGLIAKKNPENFELQTANATIGVRGTVVGVVAVASSQSQPTFSPAH